MELSRYAKIWPYAERQGQVLLYSTKRASLALVPEETLEKLQSGSLSSEDAEALSKLGLVTENAEAEKQELLNYLDEINRADRSLVVAVIPGLSCNFSCTYCYEGTMKGALAMGGETVERIISFIASRIRSTDKKRLILDFYGGEPLLYTGLIKHIAGGLKRIAEKKGVDFSFTLVTNGSLLTRKTAEELVPLGLAGAKITIDGPAELHNSSRPFKSGAGSFETILENVRKTCDLLPVGISGNFTKESYHAFPALLDTLMDSGLGPGRLAQIRFHPVMKVTDRHDAGECSVGCASTNEPWLAEASVALREEILRRGYKTPKIVPSPCMVDLDGAFVVNWDETLYKCPGFIGHGEFSAGDLSNGIKDYSKTYHVGHWKNSEECRSCEYIPLCFGGCRYMKYQMDRDISGVDCRKSFLDATLESLVKQEVRYGLAGR